MVLLMALLLNFTVDDHAKETSQHCADIRIG